APKDRFAAALATVGTDRLRQRHAGFRRLERKSDRQVTPDRPTILVANGPDALPPTVPVSPVYNATNSDSLANPREPLRMEIQTRNPHIRIIWFSPHEPKHASSNSKGI